MTNATSERRRHARQNSGDSRVTCRSLESVCGPEYNFARRLVDVSKEGIRILSVGRLRPGIRMDVEIRFPQSGLALRGKATVRWSKESTWEGHPAHLTGIQFDAPPACTMPAPAAPAPARPEPLGPDTTRIANRRRSLRFRVQTPEVICTPPGFLSRLGLGPNLGTAIVDLSPTGARVRAKREWSPGERIRLVVPVPGLGRKIRAEAEVRWCRRPSTEPDYLVGVRFVSIAAGSEGALAQLRKYFAVG